LIRWFPFIPAQKFLKKATTPAPTTPVSVDEEETDSVALGTIEGGPEVVEGYWNKPAETGDVAGNYFQKIKWVQPSCF